MPACSPVADSSASMLSCGGKRTSEVVPRMGKGSVTSPVDDCKPDTIAQVQASLVRLDRPRLLSEAPITSVCTGALSAQGLDCDAFGSPLTSFVSGCQSSIGRFGNTIDIKRIVDELSANATDSSLPSASHKMAAALGNYMLCTETELQVAGIDEAVLLEALHAAAPCGVDPSVLRQGATALQGSPLSLLTNTDRALLLMAQSPLKCKNLLFIMLGVKELLSTTGDADWIDSVRDVNGDLIKLVPPISLGDWSCGATIWLAALHKRVRGSLQAQLQDDLSKMAAAASVGLLPLASLDMQSGARHIRFLAARIWLTRLIDNLANSERQAVVWCAAEVAALKAECEGPGMGEFMVQAMELLQLSAQSAVAHVEAGGSRPALRQPGALRADWDGECAWVTMQLDPESSVQQPFEFELPSDQPFVFGMGGNDAVAAKANQNSTAFRRAIFTEMQPSRPGVLVSICRPGSGSTFWTMQSLMPLGLRKVEADMDVLGVRGVHELVEKTASAGSRNVIMLKGGFGDSTVEELKQLLDLYGRLRSDAVLLSRPFSLLVLTVVVGPAFHTHVKKMMSELLGAPDLGKSCQFACTLAPGAFVIEMEDQNLGGNAYHKKIQRYGECDPLFHGLLRASRAKAEELEVLAGTDKAAKRLVAERPGPVGANIARRVDPLDITNANPVDINFGILVLNKMHSFIVGGKCTNDAVDAFCYAMGACPGLVANRGYSERDRNEEEATLLTFAIEAGANPELILAALNTRISACRLRRDRNEELSLDRTQPVRALSAMDITMLIQHSPEVALRVLTEENLGDGAVMVYNKRLVVIEEFGCLYDMLPAVLGSEYADAFLALPAFEALIETRMKMLWPIWCFETSMLVALCTFYYIWWKSGDVPGWLVVVLASFFGGLEMVQMHQAAQGPFKISMCTQLLSYAIDPYNVIDTSTSLAVILTVLLEASKTHVAFTLLLLLLKAFGSLRALSTFAFLISMLLNTFWQIAAFFALLVMIICGASVIFDTLVDADDVELGDWVWRMYRFGTLGDFDPDDYWEDGWSVAFFVLLTVVIFIVMLNVLITLVGESYGQAQASRAELERRTRAETIRDLEACYLCPWAPAVVRRGKVVRMVVYPQFLSRLAGVQLRTVGPLHVDGMFIEDKLKLNLDPLEEPQIMISAEKETVSVSSKDVEMQTTREVLRALSETLEENKRTLALLKGAVPSN